jgi:hypothetical protein
LFTGLKIKRIINSNDKANNNRCTDGGATKKSKGGATGNNLSIVHNLQPIIFVIIQKMQVD